MQNAFRRSRGTILILVVAILGLLVVMGTAYLASSRINAGAARQALDATNLDIAVHSVLAEVQNKIFESNCGSDGDLWSGIWTAGKYYTTADYVVSPSTGRVYKCINPHTSGDTHSPPPSADWQLVAAVTTQPFTARLFDYPERPSVAAPVGISQSNYAMRDQAWLVGSTIAGNEKDISILRPNRFSPQAGNYSLQHSLSGETRVVNPSENVLDGAWNMLPMSSSGGVRFRYALRIIDSNRLANLNVSQAGQAVQYNPRVLTSLVLNSAPLFLDWALPNMPETSPSANALNSAGANGVHGRAEELAKSGGILDPVGNANMLTGWQQRVLAYEVSGRSGGLTSLQAEWFDLTDELELRSYGTVGNGYMARPATNHSPSIWPLTLMAKSTLTGGSDTANTRRQFFTTYSFDRSIAPVAGAASVPFTLTVTEKQATDTTPAGTYRWPGEGQDGFWRRPLDVTRYPASNNDTDVARAAVYLMNAMYAAGYSQQECMSYAINWIGQTDILRRGSSIGQTELRLAPLGGAGTGQYSISGPTSATRYFSYAAQPFINEIATYRRDDGTDPAKLKDLAIELLNPYVTGSDATPDGIDLSGWRIRLVIHSSTPTTHIATIPSSRVISKIDVTDKTKASGIRVIRVTGGNGLAISGTPVNVTFPDTEDADPLPLDITGAVEVFLERPYYTSNDPTYIVVDYATFTPAPMAPFVTGKPAVVQAFSLQRANFTAAGAGGGTPRAAAGTFDPWLALSARFATAAVGNGSLGLWNAVTATDGIHYSVDLPDRLQIENAIPDYRLWNNLNLIGDMVNYSRFANSDGVSTGINNRISSIADPADSLFPDEAKLKLDFVSDPRAAALTNLLTTVDRTTDGCDQIGQGVVDSESELRLPGRVNLNTASVQVIYALIRGTTNTIAMSDWSCAQRAAYIVAYRDRAPEPPSFVYGISAQQSTYKSSFDPIMLSSRPVPNFSNPAHFPGRGIRSLAELQIPLGIADYTVYYNNDDQPPRAANVVFDAFPPAACYGLNHVVSLGGSSDGNGATWQKLLASATVRSDVFVAYGYIEAVKPNANYTSKFNNADHWYTSVTTGKGMASRVPGVDDPIQLVASRRFIAILDRSWSNTSRGAGTVLPKIVAYKELPR